MSQNSESSPAETPTSVSWGREFLASIVVFFVALPLCMGIAMASGAPPALGLVTGIVGGLVVGFIAGQPLQVSGPAAGLAVMVLQFVQDYGLSSLGLCVLIAGAVQLTAGFAGIGRWFRAVAPAVIQGMLAGIGVLIFASQFHVMVDDKRTGTGIENLMSIPSAVYKGIFPLDGSVHHLAASIGIVTILTIVMWNKFRPQALRAVPAPLLGVVVATVAAQALGLGIAKVEVPTNMLDSLNWVTADSLSLLSEPAFWAAAVGMAIIASAETLLCATAVDRMHDGQRTNYDKELRAQGVGNILCGVVGALPMTGVIVRSSANIDAGAKTKWSAILHGAWILVLVVAFPQVLALIPSASLGAILVYTGWKLLNIPAVRRLAAKGRSELLIWGATVTVIVSKDLLLGVATGIALSLFRLVLTFTRLDIRVHDKGNVHTIELVGTATFMSLPKLADALEAIPDDVTVNFHIDDLSFIDNACTELMDDWKKRRSGEVVLEAKRIERRSKGRMVRSTRMSDSTMAPPPKTDGARAV